MMKQTPTILPEILSSIQLGIEYSTKNFALEPTRDLLWNDFVGFETVYFPADGSSQTPPHQYRDFSFKVHAPMAFVYFQQFFATKPNEYVTSMCSAPLQEPTPCPPKSALILSCDGQYIIETLQNHEFQLFLKLLPGYYFHLAQNPCSMLPKFHGLYSYQCKTISFRFVVMKNVLPPTLPMHFIYNLTGSLSNQRARKKDSSSNAPPIFKDANFLRQHPSGLFLEGDSRDLVLKTIKRDCTMLESFNIMGYSLLVGVHCLEEDKSCMGASAGKLDKGQDPGTSGQMGSPKSSNGRQSQSDKTMRSVNKDSLTAGIAARNEAGDPLLLFFGIIDIFQSYELRNQLKHALKLILQDEDKITFCQPNDYAARLQSFALNKAFKKINLAPKHSPIHRLQLEERKLHRTPSPSAPSESSSTSMQEPSKPSVAFDFGGKAKNKPKTLDIPIPKFGEKLSPSNVMDWLKVHEAFDESKIAENTTGEEEPNNEEKTSNAEVSVISSSREHRRNSAVHDQPRRFPNLIERRNSGISHRGSLRRRNSVFSQSSISKRRTSILSQSGMSNYGSIVRTFPPIDPGSTCDIKRSQGRADRISNKQKYFEYADYFLNEGDGEDDNIINSVSSFLEVKRNFEENIKRGYKPKITVTPEPPEVPKKSECEDDDEPERVTYKKGGQSPVSTIFENDSSTKDSTETNTVVEKPMKKPSLVLISPSTSDKSSVKVKFETEDDVDEIASVTSRKADMSRIDSEEYFSTEEHFV